MSNDSDAGDIKHVTVMSQRRDKWQCRDCGGRFVTWRKPVRCPFGCDNDTEKQK